MSEERTQEARSELWVVWGPVEKDGRRYPEHCAGWKEACHEHINDAINEHDLEEARQWTVVQHSNEAAALIENKTMRIAELETTLLAVGSELHTAVAKVARQAAEIARLTAFQSSMRCPNCDVVRLQFMEAEADAQEQARLVGMGAEREAALMAERDDWKRIAGIRLAELRLMDAYVCDAPKCEERGCDGHCNSALPPMSGFIERAEAAEAEARQERERAQLAWSENEQASAAMHFAKQEAEEAKAEARQLREQLAEAQKDAAHWTDMAAQADVACGQLREQLKKWQLDYADTERERDNAYTQLAACERDAANWRAYNQEREQAVSFVAGQTGIDKERVRSILLGDAAMSAKEDK